ncbi:MAG: hemolysin family protein [Candidatus Hydrothermarchaeota archaeon]
MSTLMWAELILLTVLVLLSGFFSGSETALISLNKIRIKYLVQKGEKRAKTVDELLKQPNRLLATILIGNNLVNVAASALATSLAIQYFGNKGIGIATGVMTLVLLMFGEISPKAFATKNAEKVSFIVSKPIKTLEYVFYPVIEILTKFTNFIVRILGGEAKASPFITEEEIKTMLYVGEEEGEIEPEEREMIHKIFEFGETTVKEVLVPRMDMVCIEANRSLEEAVDKALEHGFSRLPVYEGTVDNIVGIVHIKDLFTHIREKRQVSLKEVMRPTYYVPETKKVSDLLKDLQRSRQHMAICTDEYGGTVGLVTIEDLLEEIVGEITDEHDPRMELIKKVNERTYIVNGAVPIDDLNKYLGSNFPEENSETIGGFVFHCLGKLPKPGDSIEYDGYEISVQKIEKRRIVQVKIIKPLTPSNEEN